MLSGKIFFTGDRSQKRHAEPRRFGTGFVLASSNLITLGDSETSSFRLPLESFLLVPKVPHLERQP